MQAITVSAASGTRTSWTAAIPHSRDTIWMKETIDFACDSRSTRSPALLLHAWAASARMRRTAAAAAERPSRSPRYWKIAASIATTPIAPIAVAKSIPSTRMWSRTEIVRPVSGFRSLWRSTASATIIQIEPRVAAVPSPPARVDAMILVPATESIRRKNQRMSVGVLELIFMMIRIQVPRYRETSSPHDSDSLP